MYLLLDNITWMAYNLALAVLPLIFGWYIFSLKRKLLKLISFVLWFVFIPNTFYLVLDVTHLREQYFRVIGLERLLLIFQYLTLVTFGVLTFYLAFYPLEKLLRKITGKKQVGDFLLMFSVFIMNFAIGFGLTMGRVQRTNSWDIFFNLKKVIKDIFVITSSAEMMIIVAFFGLIANFTYFSARHIFQKYDFSLKKYLR